MNDVLRIIKLLDMAVTLAQQVGVNVHKYQDLRDQADIEGRDLTNEELEFLARDERDAIDQLTDDINDRLD